MHCLLCFTAQCCRYTAIAGIQCFCPYDTCDVRPLNSTQCIGIAFVFYTQITNDVMCAFQISGLFHSPESQIIWFGPFSLYSTVLQLDFNSQISMNVIETMVDVLRHAATLMEGLNVAVMLVSIWHLMKEHVLVGFPLINFSCYYYMYLMTSLQGSFYLKFQRIPPSASD